MTSFIGVLKTQNYKVILVTVLITAAVFSPVYFHRIADPVDTDYGSHIYFTQLMLDGQGLDPLNLAHPIIQFILAGMHIASFHILSLYSSLMVLQVLVQIITVLILYLWFGPSEQKNWDWLRAGAAISVTLVAPVMLLAFSDGLFYYGYIGLANYHNPTIHLLKPVALLSFMYAIRAISGERFQWGSIILSALWITLSTWIKPNYALSILPALGMLIGLRLLQRKFFDWKILILGFYLPALCSLTAQWLIAYYWGDPGEGIVFAPFSVEGAFSQHLAIKLILSIIFPLAVLVIARKKLWTDPGFLVGWVGFVVGVVQVYFLAEGGERMLHGNFRWSGQIMLFLLFAVSIRWWLKEKIYKSGKNLYETLAVYESYIAHVVGGIAYYIYCMTSIHYR
jgi:hypothetical protein